jgi:hypothetical protein
VLLRRLLDRMHLRRLLHILTLLVWHCLRIATLRITLRLRLTLNVHLPKLPS